MKLIVAIVRPFKVAEIVDAIDAELSFPGMTVVDGRGFGRAKKAPHVHGPNEDLTDFVDCAMILVAAPDDVTTSVVNHIERLARTGRDGDGMVFVVPLESVVRIASGERGESGL